MSALTHSEPVVGPRRAGTRRVRSSSGSGMVTVLVLMFSFTGTTVVWLARDVDRALSHRASAQLVAYESARAGAQQIDTESLRLDGELRLDAMAAATAVAESAASTLGRLGLAGSVASVSVVDTLVTVEIEITDGARSVRGVGAAQAEFSQ